MEGMTLELKANNPRHQKQALVGPNLVGEFKLEPEVQDLLEPCVLGDRKLA
jgi:hypothetical protein